MRGFLLIFISISCLLCQAQVVDSVLQRDSLPKIDTAANTDSLLILPVRDTISRDSVIKDSLFRLAQAALIKRIDTSLYNSNPFYQFSNPTKMVASVRKWEGKEEFFYAIAGLLLFFALQSLRAIN